MHRVDGRAFWFAGYFNVFQREPFLRYAGQVRADRFQETFRGKIPFANARIVKVFDPDPKAAAQFTETFGVPAASTLEEFADELDGVIVPFPAGGRARDYAAIAPLVERGIPLFLDRIILEQADELRRLCARATELRAPLHVTCFIRYFAELLLPERGAAVRSVSASTGGDVAGYGADLLDLVDELMNGTVSGVANEGDENTDILRIRYKDGREAELRLFHNEKQPMRIAVNGDGWSRSHQLDGTQNHFGAMRQFEAFLRSLETREPPVSYDRLMANARVLQAGRLG